MTVYLMHESHTLASALRPALEAQVGPEEFVACTHVHPLDDHLQVDAPSVATVRTALLSLKEQIANLRRTVLRKHSGDRD